MFVHLHLHTEYSLADGLIRVEPGAGHSPSAQSLTARAAELGLPALAVTDQDNLFAMVKFYKLAEAAGLKPIVGADVRVDEGAPEAPQLVTLLVQNETGYRNLTRLLSQAYQDGQERGVATVKRQWLGRSGAGLIALAGRHSALGRALLAGHGEVVRVQTQWWQQHFPDRLYLEICRCGRPQDEPHLRAAVAYARAQGLPVVATNDVRFLRREDFEAHEARVCIAQGRTLADPRRAREYTPEQYLKSAAQMRALFADLPEAVENTVEIARRCTLTLEFGRNHLPDFPVPPGTSVAAYLRDQARVGLRRRLAAVPADAPQSPQTVYEQRLEYELGVIESMGFAGYFLVVADFIAWAKSHDVPVGPGRGSGAGSLVAYALGITDLDPLRYDLLFERFLNPERVSLPDFDVDFCMEGRDRVIDYVAHKYGRDRVSQIITYSSMAARNVVRDVARVLGHPYALGDKIAKLIPGAPAFKMEAEQAGCSTLEYALQRSPELRSLYEADEEVRAVVDLGRALEDLARGVGIHAGGVVIAPRPLTEYAPLYCEPGGAGLRTQFDMKDLEAVGLIKFDFLGLRTLTIIANAVREINARQPGNPVDILRIPLDDRETYALYASGYTTAVFQMESQGMQRAAVELKPDRFEDLIALISLYRPGPMENIPDFCARKHGRQKIELLHPAMAEILAPTYGIIVYQEQVMQLAQRLAGYSLGAADLLRRAMGKKKPEEMAAQRAVFVAGCRANGIAEKTASEIFDLMEKFANYGFNKSHAAAYALVSYQTAWLKAHYPAQFMAAVMSAEMNHTDTVVTMLDECRRMGLRVHAPDINASAFRFAVDGRGEILYGLGAIKGVGEGAVAAIMDERERGGPFRDLFDLCRRIDTRRVNKRVLEALILSGALDRMGPNRPSLLAALPQALQLAEQAGASVAAGQDDLFGLAMPAPVTGAPVTEQPDWPPNERLAREKEVLGLYFSGHPIESHRALIEQLCSGCIKRLIEECAAPAFAANGGEDGEGFPRRRAPRRTVLLAGWLAEVRTVGGERPGKLVVLDDRTAQIVIWLGFEDWQKYQTFLRRDTLVFAAGEIRAVQREGREQEYRLYPRGFWDLDGILRSRAERVTLVWRNRTLDRQAPARLAKDLSAWRADDGAAVTVEYCNDHARATLDFPPHWRLRVEQASLAVCKRWFGEDAVQVSWRRWIPPAGARPEYGDGE
jgi:DNA polymerase-3 subunit alpha